MLQMASLAVMLVACQALSLAPVTRRAVVLRNDDGIDIAQASLSRGRARSGEEREAFDW